MQVIVCCSVRHQLPPSFFPHSSCRAHEALAAGEEVGRGGDGAATHRDRSAQREHHVGTFHCSVPPFCVHVAVSVYAMWLACGASIRVMYTESLT